MEDEDLKLLKGVAVETPRGYFRASTLPLARLREMGWGVHFTQPTPSGLIWYIVSKGSRGIACTEKGGI